MKTLLPLLFGGLLLASPLAAESVKVVASQAIRIAFVDTHAQRGDPATLAETLAPRFEEAVTRIYGADTPVDWVHTSAAFATDGLRRGTYDAALVFTRRLPVSFKRAGCHALRGVTAEEPGAPEAYLILRRQEPELDNLLANAFSVAIQHVVVRRALDDRRSELALAGR